MWSFVWQVLKRVPGVILRAANGAVGIGGVLATAIALFNRSLARGLTNWEGFSPLWALVPFGALLDFGLIRASYEVAVEREQRAKRDHQSAGPVLTGGAGGAGGSADGSIGDIVHAGHGGGGGAVLYGGAVGAGGEKELGGKGGGPGGPTPFECLAKASLGMGYGLGEFFGLAGFKPDGHELHRVGRGGDAGEAGGDGLIVVSIWTDESQTEKKGVIVCKPGGYAVIRPKGSALGSSTVTVSSPPGEPFQLTVPADLGGPATVELYGGGGGGGQS